VALFRKKPSLSSSGHAGHAGDHQLLGILARHHGPLEKRRHWVHYLYTSDEAAARMAAEAIVAAGWGLQRVDEAAQGPGWVVIAEKHDAQLNADAVSEARRFFEGVAAGVSGGDYDGWEASG
jgi:hypothetical protein